MNIKELLADWKQAEERLLKVSGQLKNPKASAYQRLRGRADALRICVKQLKKAYVIERKNHWGK